MRANTFELERTRRPTRSPKVALLWCAPFRTRAAVVGCAPTNQRATPLPSSLLLLLLLPPALREGTTESLASYNLMLAFLHAAPSHRHMSAPGSMRKKTGKAKSKKQKKKNAPRPSSAAVSLDFHWKSGQQVWIFFLPSLSSLHAP